MTTASSMIPIVPTTAPVAAVTPNVVNSVNTSTQQFNSAEPTTISIPPASTVAEEQKRYSLEKPQQTQVRSSVNEGRPTSYAGGKLFISCIKF